MRPDEIEVWEQILEEYPDVECHGHDGDGVCQIHLLNMRRVLAAWAMAIDIQEEGNHSLAFRVLMTCGTHVQTIGDRMLDVLPPDELFRIQIELAHPEAHVIVFNPHNN